MSQHRISLLGTLVMLAAAMWVFTARPKADKRTQESDRNKVAIGVVSPAQQPLPAYHMANISQQELPPDELSHGRVLLVYLTTSCEPCVEQARIIARLHEASLQNLRIYGVSFERPAQVATFVQEFDLKFPMLIDMSAQLARSLDIHYFPSTYLVEDGVITKVWRGVTHDETDLYHQLSTR